MRVQNKKVIVFFFMIGCVIFCYWLWLCLRPVEIVAVHEDGNYSSVLVRSFPPTDKGKISWWLKNKDMVKKRYDFLKPAHDGNFTVIFWLFGDGYKEQGKYDRLCFDDIKTKVNCIEKDALFSVMQYGGEDVIFATYEGRYSLNRKGEIIKIKK